MDGKEHETPKELLTLLEGSLRCCLRYTKALPRNFSYPDHVRSIIKSLHEEIMKTAGQANLDENQDIVTNLTPVTPPLLTTSAVTESVQSEVTHLDATSRFLSDGPKEAFGPIESGRCEEVQTVALPTKCELQPENAQPASAVSIPYELLVHILDLACAPSSLIDPHIRRGPKSAWSQNLRFQKALASVCKAWWEPAHELLYHHVVIRRLEQLPLLFRTLLDNATLRSLVKEISVLCHIVTGHRRLLDLSLAMILSACPNISRIAYNPTLDGPISPVTGAVPDFVPKERLSQIIHIDLGALHTVPELARFSNITLLSCDAGNFAHALDDKPYTFRVLEELRLSWFSPIVATVFKKFSPVVSGLHLPALRRLTFLLQWNNVEASVNCGRFLDWHGSQLRFLAVDSTSFPRIRGLSKSLTGEVVQKWLDKCPMLEHLVVPRIEGMKLLRHPNLHSIDIVDDVYNKDGTQPTPYTMSGPTGNGVPRLRATRLLDCALFKQVGPTLPLLIPPERFTTARPVMSWFYPGLMICATEHVVCSLDMECLRVYGFSLSEDPDLWEESDGEKNMEFMEGVNEHSESRDSEGVDSDDETYVYESGSLSESESSEMSDDAVSEAGAEGPEVDQAIAALDTFVVVSWVIGTITRPS
ncbi:hypothetical protein CONPUDRAFT_144380 [Coniophora puteana RWD-64-598 SS2]|uniref:F-box domain-containing protein n=1 Tax=Coniophora puteana (strain RWD-64-598) TaxID=741705 RepID=A0A5M3MME8_CONPW|nr:uncharacterized protein CONPUDRAFT_144380 [Coniophora puteana RWD-64-598 SS2]EIW80190.1 hypothetical protein CONPUDRAFT_144380 [Coniophora puteana RWD-64-598 SS2]